MFQGPARHFLSRLPLIGCRARAFFLAFLVAVLPVVALAEDDDAPTVELAPVESAVLERINRYREAAGVGPTTAHPSLMQAAVAHIGYYDANLGDPSLVGPGLHRQNPEAPGFTGVTMGDRARAAGYSGGPVTENAGSGRLDAAVEWYMGTVNHRLPLIHPSALDIGLAHSADSGFGIIDVGLRGGRLDVSLPSVYPSDGATDVPTAWDGAEAPDPAPGLPRPLGYPITVAFARHQQVEWQVLELRDSAGEPLELSTPRTDWMRAIAIIPHRPLAPGQTYTARVEALVDGSPLTKEWSFTTRA